MPVVTELTIDASGAQRGADIYQASMDKASAAMERSLGALSDGVRQSSRSVGSMGALAVGLGGTIGTISLFVDQVVKANSALAQMGETARLVGLSTDRLQQVSFAFKIGGATDQNITSSLTQMTALLNDAKNNENSLSKLLDENNVKYKQRNGSLIDTNRLLEIAADLIKRAATPQSEVSIAKALGIDQSLIPTLREWGDEAQRTGDIISKDVIDRATQFDAEWRKASVEWSTYMRAGLSGLLPYIDDLISKASEYAATAKNQVATAAGNVTSETLKNAGLPDEQQIEKNRQWFSLFKESFRDFTDWFFTTAGVVKDASDRIKIAFDQLPPSPPEWVTSPAFSQAVAQWSLPDLSPPDTRYLTNPSKDPPGSDSKSSSEFDRLTKSLERMTAARQADIQTVGKSVGEQEYLRTAYKLNEAALQQYGEVTDETRKKIDALARSAGDAAQKLAEKRLVNDVKFESDTAFLASAEQRIAQQMRGVFGDDWKSHMNDAIADQMRFNDVLRQTHQLASDFASSFISDLRQGVQLGDALGNAMNRLADRLIQMATDQAINMLFKNLSGILGGGGGSPMNILPPWMTGSANGNVFYAGNVIPFARGGIVDRPTLFPMANGAGLMGEAGPEAVMPLRRTPDGRLGVVAAGGAASAPAAPVTISLNIDARGAEKGSGEEIARTLRAFVETPQFRMRVVDAMRDARSRRAI